MKSSRHFLGSLDEASEDEKERYERVWTKLTAWCQDAYNVGAGDHGALVNALVGVAVQTAIHLGGSKAVFLQAAEALWDRSALVIPKRGEKSS